MSLDLSIIIPAYNRVDLLRYTLESVARAIQNLKVEVLVVDDGSEQPLAEQLTEFNHLPIHFIRQENQGSIVARQTGLKQATGEYILFLDSDDIVHPDKLIAQISRMREQKADISYTDSAVTTLTGSYDSLVFKPTGTLPTVEEAAEFYLKVQPMPHSPIYRRSYIQKHLENPLVPENRIFDSVGDVWIYHNLAIYPAKVIKVDGHYTVGTLHDCDRFTRHWERLGVAAVALKLAFIKKCPKTEETLKVRQYIGECAFISWRRLPNQFNQTFESTILSIWRNSPKTSYTKLGGKKFQLLATIIGPENAGRIFKSFQRPNYSKTRTISESELQELVNVLAQI
ncbi:MAG: glycosyltransferase family 2 protein [Lyngbya sp.]|nr:glycosyltransferase family 2 protein [Lyngbya sp.]